MAHDAAYEAYVRLHGENGDLKTEIDRLKTELAAAQKDAARWHYVKENAGIDYYWIIALPLKREDQYGTFEQEVDAAMNAQDRKHIYL